MTKCEQAAMCISNLLEKIHKSVINHFNTTDYTEIKTSSRETKIKLREIKNERNILRKELLKLKSRN